MSSTPERKQSKSRVRLSKLSKYFGTVTAVEKIKLEAGREELLGLVGPSGCGKTTTLRLIAGFDQPDEGDILIDGRSILHLQPEERDIGIVFQDYALFPHLSVSQNIGYGLRFQENFSRKDRIEEMLALVDMEELADRRPDQLSAGQKQRVSLARSLAPAPGILLLDEPLSSLDQKLQEQLKLEIKTIHEELDLTTFWVTHDQAQALSVADSVAVMNQGHIEQVGKPKEVYRRPKNEFTAKFIGKGNILRGRVKKIRNSKANLQILDAGLLEIEIAEKKIKEGETINLLVRPEDLELSPPSDGDSEKLIGTVVASEFMGDSTLVHLKIGDERILIKVDDMEERGFSAGQRLAINCSTPPHLLD